MKKEILFVLAGGALATTAAASISLPALVKAETRNYLSRTFTTDGIADAYSSTNITVADSAEFVGIRPSDGAQNAYLTYELSTLTEGNVFTALNFSLSGGRFAYFYEVAPGAGESFDIYVGTDTTLGSPVYHLEGTDSPVSEITADLSTAVSALNASTFYITFGFTPKAPGLGFDTSWIGLNNLSITGDEGEGGEVDPAVHTYRYTDDFASGTDWHGKTTAQVTGLGGDGNTTHGAIVGTWGATLSVEAGASATVVYHFSSDTEALTEFTFNFRACFNNMGNETMHWGDCIRVLCSLDGMNWTTLKEYRHAAEYGVETVNNSNYNGSVSLGGLKNREGYVGMQLVHDQALTNIELGSWGMKLFQTSIELKTHDALTVKYNLDGGSLPNGTLDTFYSTDSTYTLPTPSKEGYDFNGWENALGEVVTTFDPSSGESLEVTAKWTLQSTSHSITYVDEVGADNPNPGTYSTDGGVVTLSDLEATGYTFLGWYTEDGVKVTAIDPATSDTDITLYARWEEKTYTITYEISEHAHLSVDGASTLPSEVKFTERFEYALTIDEGYGLAKIVIDGAVVNPDDDIVIVGSGDKAHTLAVETYELGHVSTTVNQDFASLSSFDNTWAAEPFEFANLVLIHDGNDGAGLCKKAAGDAYLTYKFVAGENKTFDKVKIGGLARIFDFNGNPANFTVLVSTDNSDWTPFKEYSPLNLQDGGEKVSLGYQAAIEETEVLYVKIVWNCESAGLDWVVLKNLTLEIGEKDKTPDVPPTSSDIPTSSEVPTSSETPVSSETSQGGRGGCGGSIIATSAVAGITLIGALAIALIKRKK